MTTTRMEEDEPVPNNKNPKGVRNQNSIDKVKDKTIIVWPKKELRLQDAHRKDSVQERLNLLTGKLDQVNKSFETSKVKGLKQAFDEEDQEEGGYVTGYGKTESAVSVKSVDVYSNQHDSLRAKMKSKSTNHGKSGVPKSTYSYKNLIWQGYPFVCC